MRLTMALTLAALPLAAQAATPALRVGAAKVNIVPARADRQAVFPKVADDLFLRAVLIDSDNTRGMIIVADVPMISPDASAEITAAAAKAAHLAPDHVLLASTHAHNSLRVDRKVGGILLPGSPAYVEHVKAAAVEAAAQAEGRLQPARMSVGKGKAWLVGGKNSWSPTLGRWIEQIDRSDEAKVSKALGVLSFETPAGKPIAIVMNYAINPVIAMALKGQISGDVPGAAERYVEQRGGDGMVALFTIGSAGNPLYRPGDQAGSSWQVANPRALIDAMGTVLGEEAIAVARTASQHSDHVPISTLLTDLDCPGKATSPLNLPERCSDTPGGSLPRCDFHDADAPPVTLRMGLMKLGPVALISSDSDISGQVGLRLQKASPLADTFIIATSYGPMHYVVDDSDYPLNTYEATATTAKRGCAATGYVDKALTMIGGTAPGR
ncbi:hypothetical protein [Novosphingobium terrae]|uniref:hypothetical protein n=1 Tax=Novosphingobium terrae TaxID=2726189 RepID=UPI001980DD48|nr:hypothetical protein [Novosphingobium terrae]